MMKMTVLIPTYRRPKDLERCLKALQQQIRPADEVLVTVRDIDAETWTFLATFDPHSLPLKVLTVTAPGVVAAINLGFETTFYPQKKAWQPKNGGHLSEEESGSRHGSGLFPKNRHQKENKT